MKYTDRVIDTYSQLNEVEMPPQKREEIWNYLQSTVEREVSYDLPYNVVERIQPRNGRQWRKRVGGLIASIAAICVAVVVTVGVMRHTSLQYTSGTPAENAVQQYISKQVQPFLNKHNPGTVEKVTHNMASTPGGDFVAAQITTPKGTTYYKLFYVSKKKDGKWTVQDTQIKYDPKSNPLPFNQDFGQNPNAISFIEIGVPKKLPITKVTIQARFKKNGKDIPLSLTKVGTLPLWVYNLTSNKDYYYPSNNVGAMVWTDSVTAYNSSGNIVWSPNLK